MRNKILTYLKNDRSFEAGLRLYMEYGNNKAFKKNLNNQGKTDFNHRMLHEELRKLSGLSETEFKSLMKQPKVASVNTEPVSEAVSVDKMKEEQVKEKTTKPVNEAPKKKATQSRKKSAK